MKKGIERETIIGLTILLISLLVLWPVVANATGFIQSYKDGGMCGLSVFFANLKAPEKFCYDTINSPFAIECPRSHIDIGNQILISKEGKLQKPIGPASSEKIETVMLDELASCWQKFGKGENILFIEGVPGLIEGTFGKDSDARTVCNICSEISFGDVDVSGVDLQKALNNKMTSGKKTYKDFLNNPDALCEEEFSANGTCWSNLEKWFTQRPVDYVAPSTQIIGGLGPSPSIATQASESAQRKSISLMKTIDPKKTYAVVVVRKRFDWCSDSTGDIKDISNFAYIVAHDELDKMCSVVVT